MAANNSDGTAALLNAEDAFGAALLIKHWKQLPNADDSDRREIWLNEVRELHRIAACPGAAESIVELRDSGMDEDGFYLILDAGLRSPLAAILERPHVPRWLTKVAARHSFDRPGDGKAETR